MSKGLKQIVAIICLVAFVLGGQMNLCACDFPVEKPVASSCSDDDHRHGPNHKDHAPNADPMCPCPACHTSCHHVQIILPAVELPGLDTQTACLVPEQDARPVVRPADIFNPPKLS